MKSKALQGNLKTKRVKRGQGSSRNQTVLLHAQTVNKSVGWTFACFSILKQHYCNLYILIGKLFYLAP